MASGGNGRAGAERISAVFGIFYTVGQNHYGIVERSGAFHSIVGPGSHTKRPVADTVIDVPLASVEVPVTFVGTTGDGASVTIDATVLRRVDTADAVDVYSSGVYRSLYAIENPDEHLVHCVQSTLSDLVRQASLAELLDETSDLEAEIANVVSKMFLGHGFIIERVTVNAVTPAAEVREAYDREIVMASEARAAKDELASKVERERMETEANIEKHRIEAEAEQLAAQSAADTEAYVETSRVEYEAECRKASAAATAAAIDSLVASGLTHESAAAVLISLGHIDSLSRFASSDTSTVVLPADIAGGSTLGDLLAAATVPRRSPTGGMSV